MIKLFKYILFSLLLFNICKADFEGFPIESNFNNWGSARTNKYMLQLFEAVEERCWAVTNRMTPPNIVETWSVQIGFTNQIFTRDYLTNDIPPLYKTVTYTNRLPWYATVVTTNVCTNITYNITDIDPNIVGNPTFVPFTNNPSTVTLSLPITHNFITGLDNKMFAITPYYVDLTMTNSYGKFDDWFKIKKNLIVDTPNIVPPDGGGYGWNIELYGGGSMPIDVLDKYIWRYYANNHVPSVYSDWKTNWGYNSHSTYYYPYPNLANDVFISESYPEYYPMLSPATVITNAHIGYCTNVLKDSFGHITNGVAYFTRQPINTNEWVIWQATIDKVSITLTGFGDPYDGNYYKCKAKDLNQTYVYKYGSYWIGLGKFTFNDTEIYQVESGKAAIVKMTNLYFPSDNLINPYLVFRTSGTLMEALLAPQYIEMNQLSTNTIVDPDWGEIYRDWSTTLVITNTSSTNGWRLLDPWWGGFAFGNPPAPDISMKSAISTNLLWITSNLNSFDTRYYDIQPRPFYKYTNPTYCTNGTPLVPVNLNLTGTAFINFNDPDVMGNQTVRGANESIILNNKYTASNYRWYQTLSNSISGNAPLGSTIVLMWTNSHSYGNLPYQLEAKDLDERELYLKQLLWTTTPYWKWTNCVQNNIAGYTNIYNLDVQSYTNWSNFNDWYNASQSNWWNFIVTIFPATGSNDFWQPSNTVSRYPWLTTYDFSNPNLTPVSPPASAAPYATVNYSSSLLTTEELNFITPYVFNGNTNFNHDTFYYDYPWFPGYFQVSGKQYDLSAARAYANAWQKFDGYQIGSLQWTYQSDTRLSHIDDFYIRQNSDKFQGTYSNATTTANAPTYNEVSDLFTPDLNLIEPTIPDSSRHSTYMENVQVNNYPFYYDVYQTNYHGTLMTNWFTDTIYTYASTNWTFTNDLAAAYYHDNTLGPPPDYPMVLDGYGGFWAPDGTYRGTTVFYTPTGYVNGVYQEIPHYIYNCPVVSVPYYVSNSTYYLTIPKVTNPPLQGITAWTQVITNTFTTNIVLIQIINTNPVTWIAETAYGTSAYATGLVSGWTAAHKLNQDYWSNPQFGQPGQNWGGFATFGPLWTNVYTNTVIVTNIFTEYLYWKPEELHYDIIAVQPTQFLNRANNSQTNSGSSYISIEGLDPIMRWNENNGFKRK